MKHIFLSTLALVGALVVGPALSFAHDQMHHDMQKDMDAKPSGRSLANLESSWTTQDGKTVTLSSLTGGATVIAMGYTTCKDICPAIVADMMWIEKHLPGGAENVRFAFFSIDSTVDTPARLTAYADEHGFDTARWTLYHGDEDAVRELAAALGVGFRPDGQGGFDHAAIISLLDPRGEIVFQQRGTQASSDELLAVLKGLLKKPN